MIKDKKRRKKIIKRYPKYLKISKNIKGYKKISQISKDAQNIKR